MQNTASRHIALVGFMGAGKSRVGQQLADRLGWAFADLDEVLAAAAGCTIAEFFATHGETAFRARERATLRSLLRRDEPTVIACGGGTFVDPAMRAALSDAAVTVHLNVDVATVLARVGHGEERARRPLLLGPRPEERVEALLTERAPAYAQADLHVDVRQRRIDEVVTEIDTALERLERARRRSAGSDGADSGGVLEVASSQGDYPVEMRALGPDWIAARIDALCPKVKLGVVTDSVVGPLHGQAVAAALEARGRKVTLHTVPAGEGAKRLEVAGELYDVFLRAGFGRSDTLVAVGGGVVGDLTGFVAATLLRGVPYVQVPTTTLAAVDSSVGGKTAINTAHGKNLVGAFYAPKAVLLGLECLVTQPRRGHAAGLVEALKMAACLDATLFDDIAAQAPALLAFDEATLLPTLLKSVGLKAGVVARDEREAGERAVLNYGHTIGHAIEAAENFSLLHGEAVALGMVAEAAWATEQGASPGVEKALVNALAALEAPVDWSQRRAAVAALALDKKRAAGGIVLPVVPALGRFRLDRVPVETLQRFVQKHMQVV